MSWKFYFIEACCIVGVILGLLGIKLGHSACWPLYVIAFLLVGIVIPVVISMAREE